MDLLFNQQAEDLVLINGDFDISKTTSSDLTQMLYFRLKTFKREWFWNVNYGIDYINDVFGVGRSKNSIDVLFRNEINKEYLVQSILTFESKIENYSYSCKFTVSCINEDIPLTYYFVLNEDSAYLTNENNLKVITLL